MKLQGFSKEERLCRDNIIKDLFANAAGSFFEYPLRAGYVPHALPEAVPLQLLITVSKKRFKHAHERNRIKRLIREAYRRNKTSVHEVLQQKQLQLAMVISYIGKNEESYALVEAKMQKILQQLAQHYAA